MTRRVVIAGAGPVGVWLACELRLAGVLTIVLDQTLEISPHSRALTIHPRTIETFALRGAHRELLAEGGQIPSGHFAVLDERLDFRALDTEFPFTLTIPQARTTELMQQRAVSLGAEVRRGHRFVTYVEHDAGLTVTVEGPDGEYEIETDYLVGCDGTRSTVRDSAGIDFVGTAFTALGALGDVVLSDPPEGPVTSMWNLEGVFMCVPLSDGRHRIAVHTPEDVRTDWPGDFTLDELRSRITRIAGTDYGMHSPYWLSRYSNTSRIAERYRKGRVMVAGDAAHQHMPNGGVGLNVGVQDAMNLGWKLAAVCNGWAPESLLDTYHAERHPVGELLLEQSEAQTALVMNFTSQGRELRSFMARLIGERPQLKDALVERLSGLSVKYPPSDPTAHPLTGLRAPNLRLSPEQELFPLLDRGEYVLVDFGQLSEFDVRTLDWRDVAGRIRLARGTGSASADRPLWSDTTVALIRPDGYVGWASDTRQLDALLRELRSVVDSIHGTPATV